MTHYWLKPEGDHKPGFLFESGSDDDAQERARAAMADMGAYRATLWSKSGALVEIRRPRPAGDWVGCGTGSLRVELAYHVQVQDCTDEEAHETAERALLETLRDVIVPAVEGLKGVVRVEWDGNIDAVVPEGGSLPDREEEIAPAVLRIEKK